MPGELADALVELLTWRFGDGTGVSEVLFRALPETLVWSSRALIHPRVEVFGHDSYVVLPPSRSVAGAKTWLTGSSPDDIEPAALPERLLRLIGLRSACAHAETMLLQSGADYVPCQVCWDFNAAAAEVLLVDESNIRWGVCRGCFDSLSKAFPQEFPWVRPYEDPPNGDHNMQPTRAEWRRRLMHHFELQEEE